MNYSAESKETVFSLSSPNAEGQKLKISMPENFQQTLAVINDLVFAKIGRRLSSTEILIIKGALKDIDYQEIANFSPYSKNYIQRTLAPQLWQILTETIGNGEKVSKKTLSHFLQQINQEYNIDSSYITTNISNLIVQGQMPDITSFCGRNKELEQLKQVLDSKQCISIMGFAGIGKTALAAKLIQKVSSKRHYNFDYIIWKQFNYSPLIQDFLIELIKLISPSNTYFPEYNQALISLFINYLREYRCLIVLDGLEHLFSKTNYFHKVEYETFLRRLVEEDHKSCFLLTSRNFPDEIEDIISGKRNTELLKLEGLDEESAKKFLITKGFDPSEDPTQFIQTYSGNPAEMEAVLNKVSVYFANQEKAFFENPTTLISAKLEIILNEMFGELLKDVHKQILIYLAEKMLVTREPIPFAQLMAEMKNRGTQQFSTSDLIKALEKVERLSLIESIKNSITKEITFKLQPIIRKYIITDPEGLVHTFDHKSLKLAS
ncbi:NACHT domain-containing protein [Anabaena azotica]|uniref:NACHT domain-containing protein n=1 Tax=Anabaena azotica FACHB-119 TaxID=947527 RepID=A0ABR8DD30_9NOST|nr:NACHT domain-containing protein [Anabaena azotica]MBD2505014.1 NACHT domain-containing protein [Anabaena azotica FACHB-119]